MSVDYLHIAVQIFCCLIVFIFTIKSHFSPKIAVLYVAQIVFTDFLPMPFLCLVVMIVSMWCVFYYDKRCQIPAAIWLFVSIMFLISAWTIWRTFQYWEYIVPLLYAKSGVLDTLIPSFSLVLDMASGYIALILPLCLYDKDNTTISSLMLVYLKSVLVFAVMVIISALAGILFLGTMSWDGFREIITNLFATHTNDLSINFYAAWPIALIMMLRQKERKYIIILMILFVALFFLHSRASLLSIVVETILLLICTKEQYFAKIILIFMLSIMVVAGVILFPEIASHFTTGLTEGNFDINEFTSNRYDDIWMPALDIIMDNPAVVLFGQGRYALTHLDANFPSYSYWHSHNLYLELLLNVGLPLSILYYVTFGCLLVKGFFFYKNHSDNYIILALLAIIVGHFVRGFFEPSPLPQRCTSAIWLAIGMLLVLMYKSRSKEQL